MVQLMIFLSEPFVFGHPVGGIRQMTKDADFFSAFNLISAKKKFEKIFRTQDMAKAPSL